MRLYNFDGDLSDGVVSNDLKPSETAKYTDDSIRGKPRKILYSPAGEFASASTDGLPEGNDP